MAILLFFCLFCTLFFIIDITELIHQGLYSEFTTVIEMIIVCILWSVFYHLS